MKWFDESKNVFDVLKEMMVHACSERIKRLSEMPKMAEDIFWWPFTQHKLVPTGAVTVIDSRCGENFAVSKVCVLVFKLDNVTLFAFCIFCGCSFLCCTIIVEMLSA